MDLSTSLVNAGRIYKTYSKRLEKLEISKLGDFLYHLPSRYDDFSLISKIADVQPGEIVTIKGTITAIKNDFTKRFKQIQRATVADETGSIDILWFNQPYIAKTLNFGDNVALSGRVENDNGRPILTAPAFEVLADGQQPIHTGRLVPIYPETAGVSSKWLRRQVYKILSTSSFDEFLPDKMIKEYNLMDYNSALQNIHFPHSLDQAQKARFRLSFDEVFLLQLASLKRKSEWQKTLKGTSFEIEKFKDKIEKFWNNLPFELTEAQKRSLHEIFADLDNDKPMNRLLEGDVGSGKTVVAAIAMYITFLNGFQSVLMAPTQILAQQHYDTISKLLGPLGIKIALQTGTRKDLSKDHKSSIVNPKSDIVVGTHAVLSNKLNLDKVGLVVIDEQQRFGVEQRALLRSKGTNPHVLTMTATPIPRTVALTLYGDLDLSVLDEMPIGRKAVKTWLVPDVKREGAYKWIEKKIKEGDQAFIVCPFIEESESMTTIKAATVEFERLQKNIFPHLKLGLLHGKMKAKEKDEVLRQFKQGKLDILVATPVVEVGIDIPNATIILIEASDRFGLAQLHQLRGRVGRGDKQSYCLLFTDSKNPQTTHRLKAMERIHSGASLAELDLQMRGAGELYGTLQHGTRWLKIASFEDLALIEKAKEEAQKVFKDLDKYPRLLEKIEAVSITHVSPD